MTRRATCALLVALLAAGCASVDGIQPVPVGVDFEPAPACAPHVALPQIVVTSPATLTDAMWARPGSWEVQMHFRIDEQGVPHVTRASAPPFDPDREAREQAATAALAGYRFCRPVEFSADKDWSARMRFTPSPVAAAVGGGQMFLQLFLPGYTRDDIANRRQGTNKVVGTFGQDGRPTRVRLSTSSGDATLDHKSLEAMASYQLVFRPGTVLRKPLNFEQPYTYELR